MNKFISRFIKDVVAPTAASDVSPAYLPTTIISAALNKSCNTPESIKGILKSNIFPNSGPLHISISYLVPIFTPH